jgi:hypothetical protein
MVIGRIGYCAARLLPAASTEAMMPMINTLSKTTSSAGLDCVLYIYSNADDLR